MAGFAAAYFVDKLVSVGSNACPRGGRSAVDEVGKVRDTEFMMDGGSGGQDWGTKDFSEGQVLDYLEFIQDGGGGVSPGHACVEQNSLNKGLEEGNFGAGLQCFATEDGGAYLYTLSPFVGDICNVGVP